MGHAAGGQLQLDTYGELLQTARLYAGAGERVDGDIGRRLAETADLVCRLWHEPEAGIWEVRGKLKHFAHSKVVCWIALDRAADLAERGLIPGRHRPQWRAASAAIRDFVERRCFPTGGRATRGPPALMNWTRAFCLGPIPVILSGWFPDLSGWRVYRRGAQVRDRLLGSRRHQRSRPGRVHHPEVLH